MPCAINVFASWPSVRTTTRTAPCAWAKPFTNCAVVVPLPDKLLQLEQRAPDTLSFDQAAKLVQMGASIDELTQACGLTQAEAQLMSRCMGVRAIG